MHTILLVIKDDHALSETVTDGTMSILTGSSYTEDGNFLTTTTDELGNTITYDYDADTGLLKSVTDALGAKTNYTYDAMQRIVSMTMSVTGLSGASSMGVSYTYDAGGRTKTITANGVTYTMNYNAMGALTSVASPLVPLITYTYGAAEDGYPLTSIRYGYGQTITYTYDDFGQLVAESQNGTVLFEYKYGIENETEAIYDYVNNRKTEYSYDEDGNYVVTETGINGNTDYHTYTTTDATAEEGAEEESDIYTFVLSENVGTTTSQLHAQTTYTTDADGSDITQYEMDGLIGYGEQTMTYDNFGRLSGETVTHGAAATERTDILNIVYGYTNVSATQTTNQISSITLSNTNGFSKALAYTYDANGNIISYADGTNGTVTYHYDEAGQLVRVDYPNDKTVIYTYNGGGNLVQVAEYAYTTGELGTATNVITYGYNTRWKDLLNSYNGNSITYDSSFQPSVYYNGMRFAWTRGRMLSQITDADGTVYQYTYDVNGYRVSKTVDGVTTKFMYRDGSLVYQSDGTTSLYFYYGADGTVSAFYYENGTTKGMYYYVKNLQGDIIGLLDSNGIFVVAYEYDAWGNVTVSGTLAESIGTVNPLRYRGYYYDEESGFYYLMSRYYDAVTGRFLNADEPLMMGYSGSMLSYNLFAYCYNDPISLYDDSGYQPKWAQKISKFLKNTKVYKVMHGITKQGLFKDLFYAGGFFMDSDGIYHARQDCWQRLGGYNDFYDTVFDIATSMKSKKFKYNCKGNYYMLWAWKGDYLNLGAGAELGLYYGNDPQWHVNTKLKLIMSLELKYNNKTIISYAPGKVWWLTGFNPKYQNVNADQLKAIYTVNFAINKEMFKAFYNTYKNSSYWQFYPDRYLAILTF